MQQPPEPAAAGSLDARYGRRPRTHRPTAAILGALVVVALLGWAAWAAFGSSPATVGALVRSYDVRSAHLVSVTVDITRTTSAAVRCIVTASASDHTQVGQRTVRLANGSSGTRSVVVAVRTERAATTAEVGSCR